MKMEKKGINLKKNIAIASSSEIKQICSPLEKYFNITYFNYVKLFKDGSRFVLTNNADFTESYYQDKRLYQTTAVLNMEQAKTSSVHWFCEFRDQPSYVVARNEFDIDNGFTIIQPSLADSTTELFYFATKRENYGHIYLYTTCLDAFYRFILYFKEKAKNLTKQANKEKFFINIPRVSSTLNNSSVDLQKFYAETSVNKLHMDLDGNEIVMSKREVDCIYLAMKNKTAKEIGRILSISPRTVETYLSNLKLKSNRQTKKELVSTFAVGWRRSLIAHSVDILKI
jgi:DNA-binding CsgD family transcriptional regulator